jgi:hypothetical protein
MPTFVAKIIGWFAKKNIKLEDGPMDSTKSWFKSKNIWTGVVTVLIAGYSAAAPIWNLPQIPEWVFAILGTIGIYTRVKATEKIG